MGEGIGGQKQVGSGLGPSAVDIENKVLDPATRLKIMAASVASDELLSEVLASIPEEKMQEYLDDQGMFFIAMKEAVSVRLKRSAVGGKGWQKLGMVGIAVQVLHKAARINHQVQAADEHLSIPVDDPKAMEELKNNAIDVANYALMLVGIIELRGLAQEE